MTSALDVSLSSLGDWTVILSLIFGGCCSNAWALEIAASQNRNVGSLITFAQFVLVSLVGLPKRLCILTHNRKRGEESERQWEPFRFRTLIRQPSSLLRVRFKPLAIPVSRWMVQVVLFLLTSLLNNAAFKYCVPMAIHIIFRSAGLVTNLLLGRFWAGKRYTRPQIISVIIVTVGVVLTTISTRPQTVSSSSTSGSSSISYAIGIAILTGALLLSSAMGLTQDKTYAEYGRGHWEEGMFYLHFLALPMFLPLTTDIRQQVHTVNASPPINLLSFTGSLNLKDRGGSGIYLPVFWIPLIFNIATQLVCVSGVHRLTAKVSSLTVTLVLAVRKAVSLVLSVMVIGGGEGDRWLWSGSALVLGGTMLYTWDGTRGSKPRGKPPPVHERQIQGAKQE